MLATEHERTHRSNEALERVLIPEPPAASHPMMLPSRPLASRVLCDCDWSLHKEGEWGHVLIVQIITLAL